MHMYICISIHVHTLCTIHICIRTYIYKYVSVYWFYIMYNISIYNMYSIKLTFHICVHIYIYTYLSMMHIVFVTMCPRRRNQQGVEGVLLAELSAPMQAGLLQRKKSEAEKVLLMTEILHDPTYTTPP